MGYTAEPSRLQVHLGTSQVALVVKNPPANAGDLRDMGLIPGLGRSPGDGHSNLESIDSSGI